MKKITVVVLFLCLTCSCTGERFSEDDLVGDWVALEDASGAKRIRLLPAHTALFVNVSGYDVAAEEDIKMTNGTWKLPSKDDIVSMDDNTLILHDIVGSAVWVHTGCIRREGDGLEIWFQVGDPDDYNWKRFRKQRTTVADPGNAWPNVDLVPGAKPVWTFDVLSQDQQRPATVPSASAGRPSFPGVKSSSGSSRMTVSRLPDTDLLSITRLVDRLKGVCHDVRIEESPVFPATFWNFSINPHRGMSRYVITATADVNKPLKDSQEIPRIVVLYYFFTAAPKEIVIQGKVNERAQTNNVPSALHDRNKHLHEPCIDFYQCVDYQF